MIAWWILDWIYLMIAWNFISYASYRNNLRKKVKFWPKIKIPLALDIKNWGFQLKMAGGITRQENAKNLDPWPLTKRSTGWGTDQPVRRAWELKEALARYFSHYSPPLLENSSPTCFQRLFWIDSWTDWRLWSGFWNAFEARVSIWNLGFSILGVFSFCPVCLKLGLASSPCT